MSCLQINVAAYLAMNALAIHDKCSFLKPSTTVLNAIQWTCWNTVRPCPALPCPALPCPALPVIENPSANKDADVIDT